MADTDEEAQASPRAVPQDSITPASPSYGARNKEYPGFTRSVPESFEDAMKQRNIIYGSRPRPCAMRLHVKSTSSGINYFIGSFMFGNI